MGVRGIVGLFGYLFIFVIVKNFKQSVHTAPLPTGEGPGGGALWGMGFMGGFMYLLHNTPNSPCTLAAADGAPTLGGLP